MICGESARCVAASRMGGDRPAAHHPGMAGTAPGALANASRSRAITAAGTVVTERVIEPRLGAYSVKKGCYPGQEIVARSQYLGKLKRRTTLVSIPDPTAAAGAEAAEMAAWTVVSLAPPAAATSDAWVGASGT